MDDFKLRTITTRSKDGTIEVSRSRSSAGFAGISVKVTGKCGLSFTNENVPGENAEDYEFDARELADMLTEVADDSCLLEEKPGG